MKHTWLGVLVAVGCGDNRDQRGRLHPVDAPAGAPVDARSDPVDADPCARRIEGIVRDLDSSSANPDGVENLRLTLQGGTASVTTSGDGRFTLCVPSTLDHVTLDVVADPTATPRYVDGYIYTDRWTYQYVNVNAPDGISLLAFDQERRLSFYAEQGLEYDPTKAHVLVWSAWPYSPVDFALDRGHGPAQAGTDDDGDNMMTWSAGNAGTYVLFPNVDASEPTGTLTASPNHVPSAVPIPLAADKLTLAAVVWTPPF